MSQQQSKESITHVTVYWNKKRKDAAGGAAFLSVVLIIIYALSARFVGSVGLIILLLLLALLLLAVFQPEQKKALHHPQDDKPLYIRIQEKEEAERKLKHLEAQLELETKKVKEKGFKLDEKAEKEERGKIVQSIGQRYDEAAAMPQSLVKEPEMMIYCIHCGAQLPAVASFCLKCGKPVTGAATTSGVPKNVAPQIETCEIACQRGGVLGGNSFFVARALGSKGMFIAATSTKKFRSLVGGSDRSGNDWYRPDTYSWGSKSLAEAAFDEIVTMLSSDGWQPTDTGRDWWQCKFNRQVMPGTTSQ